MLANKYRHHWLFIIPATALLLQFGVYCLSLGMPNLDGVVYADIARNMAQGLGSAWDPAYALYHMRHFYEHPALGFIVLSKFYQLFGDHVYVEKFYSLLISAMNLLLLVWLAVKTCPRLHWRHAWFVLLLWALIPDNAFFHAANMLEPVANLFALTAVLLILLSHQRQWLGTQLIATMCAAGLLLAIAFLVNGPLVLYVLFAELGLWLAYRQNRLRLHCLRWGVLLFAAIASFAAFIPAHQNFYHYIQVQLLPALMDHRQNSTHFGWHRLYIVMHTALQCVIPLLICGLAMGFGRTRQLPKANQQAGVFFVYLALTGLLPIMLSSKQMFHYSLQCYPYLVLAIACFCWPSLQARIEAVRLSSASVLMTKSVLVTALLASLVALIVLRPWYEHKIVWQYRPAMAVLKQVGPYATIAQVHGTLFVPVDLETYLARYGHISLIHQDKPTLKYAIELHRTHPIPIPGYHLLKGVESQPVALLFERNKTYK